MRFTVLGSGSCELDLARSSPAHLVRAGEASFLLDAGQGALRRLMQAGQDPADLTGVLISHHHLDHLADLLPLVFGLGYDRELKARANLTLVGHPGLGETWRGLEGVFGHWLRPAAGNLALRLLMPGEELVLGGVRIQTAAGRHLPTSLAFRLEHEGRALAYLGDSEATDELAELARGVDLLVVNCAATDEAPKPGHLAPTPAGRLARRAGARRLLLCHFYRDRDPLSSVAAASREYPGEVIAARDLMTIRLG